MWLAHTEINMTSRHLINHTKFMKHTTEWRWRRTVSERTRKNIEHSPRAILSQRIEIVFERDKTMAAQFWILDTSVRFLILNSSGSFWILI